MDISELLIQVKNANTTVSDIRRINGELNKTATAAENAGKALLTAFTFTKATQYIKSFADELRKTTVVLRSFDSLFGHFNKVANNGVKQLQENFSLTERSAKSLVSIIGSRMNFDLPQKQLAEMSVGLADLTKKISIFYGVSSEEVSRKLTNSLYGMTRGLREYGIAIDVTSPKFKKMVENIQMTTGETEEAAKALAIYTAILKDGSKFNDYTVKNIGSLSDSIESLIDLFKSDIFPKVGAALSSVLTPLLNLMNTLFSNKVVQWLTSIAIAISSLNITVQGLGWLVSWITKLTKSGAIISIDIVIKTISGFLKFLSASGKFIITAVSWLNGFFLDVFESLTKFTIKINRWVASVLSELFNDIALHFLKSYKGFNKFLAKSFLLLSTNLYNYVAKLTSILNKNLQALFPKGGALLIGRNLYSVYRSYACSLIWINSDYKKCGQ